MTHRLSHSSSPLPSASLWCRWRLRRSRLRTVPRIGLLSVFSPAIGEAKAESFRQGLRELGYIEGQNILLESRWAEGHRERLADLAADLVRLEVAIIVTESTVSALAAKQATDTIPIVMTTSGNPVADRAGGEPRPAWGTRHRVNDVHP